ncbi:hypothetical protein [Nitrosospira multiformis]|uniref:Uncharacterized protein n=1 Tax=Nitrosospira multiformis (strain ATCC 25196 / NCIMB 11849 / C 71) TaxID=323848 RepID=Q2Y7V1_NITMU|nr:hypothetical protein [Nitrosospira multiformis]ABB75170.1 hypothetical protein Nmul_A1875 [Nitrosospira multiformis ATCC 25196]SDZ97400.1 hypothetical protein SAMN05216411_103156 [Nitrosospira multiformis]SEF61393.1 hypothetical protein SAMN05216403_104144 [Nitrosospira multiformis ATCC 25196]
MNMHFTRLMAPLGFAMLIVQPVAASDDNPWGKPGTQKTQAQRGKEGSEPKPWEVRPWAANPLETKPLQPNPRESRPWEEASEEVRPKDALGQERSVETRRRAGRKARKERAEKSHESKQRLSSYEERSKQRQERWRKLQMQSELYQAGRAR